MVARSISRAVLIDAKDSQRAPSSPDAGKPASHLTSNTDDSFRRERDYASFCQSPSKEVPDYAEMKELSRAPSHRSSHKELDVEDKHSPSCGEAKAHAERHHGTDAK
jgi:hypothetical protein